MSRYGFNEFDSGRPLEPLRDLQTCVADEVALVDCPKTNLVAGVDLSYLGKHATASLVVFDRSKRKIVSQISTTQAVSFPYISTYLAYRELPVLLSVMDAAMKKGIEFDVIMVDGSGILHPRKAGVASFLGIATNRPTIGVIKKALIRAGVTKELEFGYPQEIELEKNVCGYAMLPTRETGKPIFISSGHLIQPQQALDTVLDCFESHRMPEPIHHADRHSRQVANGQKR